MNVDRILFPTDFSACSENARDYTIYLAERLNAKIYILHAIEPLEYLEVDEEVKKFFDEIELQMENKIEKEKEIFVKKGINIETEMVVGPRWRVINTFAKEKNIDLIVMGSHGLRTETDQLALGTTSHKVIFTSPCPVLLVRHER
ncbi:universal stress protein [Desulfobacterota bacterium AH_259_B03_O07]|nr:universal stress protein [Desulfobacterota bacterium AH_259_B03_O07]